jgi:hypothetical protein
MNSLCCTSTFHRIFRHGYTPTSAEVVSKLPLCPDGHMRRPLSTLPLGCNVWRSSLRGVIALASVLYLLDAFVHVVGYLS